MAKWPLYLTASCAHNVAKNFGLPEILTWLSLRCCHYQELDALKGFNFHVSVIHTWILSCPELDLERTTSQRTRKCFPTTYLHIFHVDKHFNVLFNIQQIYFKELVPGEKTAKYTYLFSGVNMNTWIQLLDGYVYSCSFNVPIIQDWLWLHFPQPKAFLQYSWGFKQKIKSKWKFQSTNEIPKSRVFSVYVKLNSRKCKSIS